MSNLIKFKVFGTRTPNSIIFETEWVLRFAYDFKPHENCLDFADALHLAQSQNFSAIYTFGNQFVNRAKKLTDCEVQQP